MGQYLFPTYYKKILVIGSIGMDQTIYSEEIPNYGEIKFGKIVKDSGGKGNIEAIACARAGGETSFMGAVGDDYDVILENTLKENYVTPILKKLNNVNSHSAHIIVGNDGKSKILVNPGADDYLDLNLVDNNMNYIDNCNIILLQLEIPIETVEHVINIAHEKGKTIILRPSSAKVLSDNIIKKVTYLMPNVSELSFISGLPTEDEEQIDKACEKVMEMGANNLIVPMGTKGSIFWNKDGKKKKYSSYDLGKVVDTTGNVDCFIGVFAAFLSKEFPIDEAIKYANLAARISCCSIGTISSCPKLEDINKAKETIKNW